MKKENTEKKIHTVSRIGRIGLQITTPFLDWLNQCEGYGVFRFRLTRLIYRLCSGYPETRNKRLDFILQYLPKLKQVYWVGLPVLDVGCRDSLLLYELHRRMYMTFGLDMRGYHAKLPDHIHVFKEDITDPNLAEKIDREFYFIIATSVIELARTGMYGEGKVDDGDRKAVENIHKLLSYEGYFIISVPTTYWRNSSAKGYNTFEFLKLIKGLFLVINMQHIGGHICAVLGKLSEQKEVTK